MTKRHADEVTIEHIIELRKKNERLREALKNLIAACDAGKIIERYGTGGQTLESQMRRSFINGVSLWAVEEARDALKGDE